ncbi:hypothetical protein AX16_009460 [Volvariella volvacea WC 439]|nr:hypothetical protein AX16_009460 [Volvariella volvacea WC 439]
MASTHHFEEKASQGTFSNVSNEIKVSSKPSRIGNPGTLGLFSFASTTLMLSLYNLQTRHINHPNVVVGMAVFCGGLAQVLAGMWEFPRGNTFGATAFTSYGAFWMSYATILIPGSGILTAFDDESELASALGIYLITWMLVTFFLLGRGIHRKCEVNDSAPPHLHYSEINANLAVFSVQRAGGGFGVVTALVAYYIGLSELLASEEMAVVRLPLGAFSKPEH